MNLPGLIAWRYLRRPTDALISAVGFASVAGLVVGVMALVISMALMTGYRRDLRTKLLAGNAEIFVYALDGEIDDLSRTLDTVKGIDGVTEAAPVIFQYSLAASENVPTGQEVMLKGIEQERTRTSEMIRRIAGDTALMDADGQPGIAIGRYLSESLGAGVGDAVTITVPSSDSGSIMPRSNTYLVTNVFRTGFYEFDSQWIYLPLVEARGLVGLTKGANLIEVRLTPDADLDSIRREIDRRTEQRYAVNDWRQLNRQLFGMLALQQLVLFIVIGLIVFVSTFNIVSTLIMTVHEKRKEIGIMLALGSTSGFVRRVFIWYGTLVGAVGTFTGLALGTLVCWIITKWELISFPREIAEVYFVSSIPFITRWTDLTIIGVFALAVSFLATLVPSARASRVTPVDALRP